MIDNGHAEATVRGYISAIVGAERYASEHSLEYDCIITDNLNVCTCSVEGLLHDSEFMKYNDDQHRRFSAAMKKYLLPFLMQARCSSFFRLHQADKVRELKSVPYSLLICRKV